MDNQKKSGKNFLSEIFRQTVNVAIGLILPRLLLVNYGSEVNGLLNSQGQFLLYLNLFEAGVGAASLQALYRPLAQDDWNSVNGVLSASNIYYHHIGLMYLIGLISFSILYPVVVDSSLPFLTVCGAAFFSGAGNVVMFYFQAKYQYLLQADGKGYIVANLSTITNIVVSLSKIILIQFNISIVLILVVSFLINCLQAPYILWYIRGYPHLCLNVPPDKKALSQRNFVLIHQINTLIFNYTDVLILTMACGLQVVSVYTVFKTVSHSLEVATVIPVSSISFILGRNYQINKPLFIRQLDLLESCFSALLYGFFSVVLFLYLPFIGLYTAGVTDINYIDPLLPVLFVLISLLSKSRMLTDNTISYAGHFRQTMPYAVLEAVINLTVSLVGVYFWGIYGVLLGTVAALAFRTNNIILYTNHKLLGRSARRTYAIYGVNIVSFVLTQLLFHCFFDSMVLDSYPRLIVAGLVCTSLSLLIHTAGQLLVFPHCRAGMRELLRGTWARK